MSNRDWAALSRQLGPQRAAYQRADPAPPATTLCARCGKALKPPAIVVTRTEALSIFGVTTG